MSHIVLPNHTAQWVGQRVTNKSSCASLDDPPRSYSPHQIIWWPLGHRQSHFWLGNSTTGRFAKDQPYHPVHTVALIFCVFKFDIDHSNFFEILDLKPLWWGHLLSSSWLRISFMCIHITLVWLPQDECLVPPPLISWPKEKQSLNTHYNKCLHAHILHSHYSVLSLHKYPLHHTPNIKPSIQGQVICGHSNYD